MSELLPVKLMNAARTITDAERSMVVDTDLHILGAVNLDDTTIQSPRFSVLATDTLKRAMEENEPIITNNIITDPSEAPTTNTNFADLRIVVALPVRGHGAIYLDQHIRSGIIPRETIDRLMRLIDYVVENGLQNYDEDQLVELYHQVA